MRSFFKIFEQSLKKSFTSKGSYWGENYSLKIIKIFRLLFDKLFLFDFITIWLIKDKIFLLFWKYSKYSEIFPNITNI